MHYSKTLPAPIRFDTSDSHKEIPVAIDSIDYTYDLLWKHGPTAMRYPLRRANSVRFFATFIAFQLCAAARPKSFAPAT